MDLQVFRMLPNKFLIRSCNGWSVFCVKCRSSVEANRLDAALQSAQTTSDVMV